MTDRQLVWLRGGVVLVLVAALLGGLLLPVYTDEVGWRFQERAGFDGVDKLYSELCGFNTLAPPPFFMWPVRWYSALFNALFAAPYWVRISGVGHALVLVVMLGLIVRRLTDDKPRRALLMAIAAGLLTLGVTPLVLVWSRPEQPIVLAACAGLLLALGPRRQGKARAAWVRSAAIVALAAIALRYHLKGLFIMPLLIGCLIFASRGRNAIAPRLIAGGIVAAMTGLAIGYWRARLACPGNPRIAAMFAQNSVGEAMARISGWDDGWRMVQTLAGNIDPLRYIARAAPVPRPLSHWLEAGQIDAGHWGLFLAAILLVWARALLVGGISLIGAAGAAVRDWRLDRRLALAVLLLAAVIGWSATQPISNVYEIAFVLPLLVLAIIVALATGESPSLAHARLSLALTLAVAAPVSAVLTGAIYGPSLLRAARSDGYIAAQRNSISLFGYRTLEPRILVTARLCGIPEPERANAVLIDDLTYFAFMRSHLPQHQLGVIGLWNGDADPVAYLKSRGSDGVVLGCHLLSPELRAHAKKLGQFCCMGPPKW